VWGWNFHWVRPLEAEEIVQEVKLVLHISSAKLQQDSSDNIRWAPEPQHGYIMSAVDILNFIILGLIGPMTAASSLREIDFGMLRLRVK
jgi:hypothetical protein